MSQPEKRHVSETDPDRSETPALAPFAQAAATLGAGDRVGVVATRPGWDLEPALRRWVGRTLTDVLDPAAARALLKARTQEGADTIEASGLFDGAAVPLSIALLRSEGVWHLHLRDRRAEVEMQGQLSRALAALAQDRREDRTLDGRHRALLDAMAEAVAVVDMETGRIVELTVSAARLLGGTAPGLAGAAFTQCFEGRRRSEFIDTLATAAVFGGDDVVRAELRHGRGGVLIEPLIHRAAEETILVCRMRRSTGSGEGRTQRGLAAVVGRTRDGIACLDVGGRITHANAAFVAMAGVAAPSRLIGQNLAWYLLRGELDLRALLGADRSSCFVTRLVAPDGRRLPVEIAATDLPGGGIGLVVRDVSLADILRGDIGVGVRRDAAAAGAVALVGSMPLRDIVLSTTDTVEQACIEAALRLTCDNRAAAASMLGLSRQSLYVKLRKFGLLGRGES